MGEKFYKISEKELKSLLEDSMRLSALDAGGVDNWSWYGDSFHDYLDNFMDENGITDREDFYFSDAAEILVGSYEEIK